MDERSAETTELLKSFGRNVRRLREAKHPPMSQERLALDIGLHRTEMGKIERGIVNPRLITILTLANGLGASLDEMVAGLIELPSGGKPSAP